MKKKTVSGVFGIPVQITGIDIEEASKEEIAKIEVEAWTNFENTKKKSETKYEKIKKEAWAKYYKIEQKAWIKFNKIEKKDKKNGSAVKIAWAQYNKEHVEALGAFLKVERKAWDEYNKAREAAKEVYDKTIKAAKRG